MNYYELIRDEITIIMSTEWTRESALYRAKIITVAIKMGVL